MTNKINNKINPFFTILDSETIENPSASGRFLRDISDFDWFYGTWSENQKLYAIRVRDPYPSKTFQTFKVSLWNLVNKFLDLFDKPSIKPDYIVMQSSKHPSEGVDFCKLYSVGNGTVEEIIPAVAKIEKECYWQLENKQVTEQLKSYSVKIDAHYLWINPEYARYRIDRFSYIPLAEQKEFVYGLVEKDAYLMIPSLNMLLSQDLTLQNPGMFPLTVTCSRAISERDKDTIIYVGPFLDVLDIKKWLLEKISAQ
jgi:hypothetical protein